MSRKPFQNWGELRLEDGEQRELWRIWALGLATIAVLCCWFWLIGPEASGTEVSGTAVSGTVIEEEAVMFEAPGRAAESGVARGGRY